MFDVVSTIFAGIKVDWVKNSVVHQSILEDLVNILRYKPYKVVTIGGYHVCFEERFCIGKGSNGAEVFVGLGNDGVEVSVKRLDLKFSELVNDERDIMNLANLKDNPNVLTYRFKIESKHYAHLITDLQDQNLKKYVLSKEVSLADLQGSGPYILRQILLGMKALHDENILHRDLKPENVLVNFQGKVASSNPKVVLGDFDICRKLLDGQEIHLSMPRGADSWRALESLPNAEDDNPLSESDVRVSYTKKSDIQVLGMLFYFVLTKGRHPFGKQEIYRAGNIGNGTSDLSELTNDVAKDLIEWMIKHDIEKRPTVKQCLKHPYVRSPEENFRLLRAVGNEMEIKTRNQDSDVVKELSQAQSLTNWSKQIDKELYDKFNHPAIPYHNNAAGLLRFIRNVTEHWNPAVSVEGGTPQAYFQRRFAELPMIVHRILRNSSWPERNSLNEFF